MRQKVTVIMETLVMETEEDPMASIPAGSQYVAMGSSFGAGPGLTPRAPESPRRAGRSASNYAHLVARALGLDLRDVTYSGATTGDILRTSARGQPAQLDAVTPATRLVTLTGGGNDVVGYLPRLMLASLPGPLRILPKVRPSSPGSGIPMPRTSGSRESDAISRRSCTACGTALRLPGSRPRPGPRRTPPTASM